MKFDPNDRLRLAALDTRDSLRRLAAKITAAGGDPQLQAEAVSAAQRISRTYADILRLALDDFGRASAQPGG
jgi:hypothetical protein